MAVPRHASSLLVLAERANGQFSILFVKRAKTNKFMPKFYVFPGGKVDDSDGSLFHNVDTNFSSFRKADGDSLDQRVACLRETFEETGLLLSQKKGMVQVPDREAWRTRVKENPNSFKDLCDTMNISPGLENLYLWTNIITPVQEKRRYDTWFYIAIIPEESQAFYDPAGETTDCVWYSPTTALELHQKGQFLLSPPQVFLLSSIKNFNSAKEVKAYAIHKPIEHITPHLFYTPEGRIRGSRWDTGRATFEFNVQMIPGTKRYYFKMKELSKP